MTYRDTVQIMEILRTAYPNYYKNVGDIKQAAGLWSELFADDDPLVVAAAVKAFIVNDEKGFPPVIGQIKTMVRDLTSPNEMTEIEAWNLVFKALKRSYYYADEEYRKLPPVVQRIVGSPSVLRDWAQIDSKSVQTVIASNFQRSYRARAKSEHEFLSLPQSTREALSSLAAKFDMQNALENNGDYPF